MSSPTLLVSRFACLLLPITTIIAFTSSPPQERHLHLATLLYLSKFNSVFVFFVELILAIAFPASFPTSNSKKMHPLSPMLILLASPVGGSASPRAHFEEPDDEGEADVEGTSCQDLRDALVD